MNPPEGPSKPRRGYFLPGIIALAFLVVLGVVLGGGDLQHPASSTVDGPAIAGQIAQAIQAVRNTHDTPVVTCPAREPVRQGLRFQCSANGAGLDHQVVYVVESGDRGEVQWSLTPP
jgi:hypothetical protein